MKEAMDHNEVRELLEDAAVEPGGLERLMAGDTPNAARPRRRSSGRASMVIGVSSSPIRPWTR